MSGQTFGAVALLVVAGVGIAALQPALLSGTAERELNETVTVDYQTESSLEQDAIKFGDDPTVKNDSGAVLEEDTDYRWIQSTGNVSWLDTNATSAGGSATVAVAYQQPGDRQSGVAGSIHVLWLALLAAAVIAAAAAAVAGVL